MSDLISRSELLKDIEYYISHTREDGGEHYAYKQCKKLIERQSPVEPVRGEWIKTFRYMRENVNTGNIEPVYSCDCPFCAWHTGNQGVRFNFCPNCGCDMRKKVEE